MEKHLPGVLSGQPGDLAELLVELVAQATDAVPLAARLGLHPLQRLLARLQIPLAAAETLVPVPEAGLPLLEGALLLLPFARLAAKFLLQPSLVLEPLLARLEERLAFLGLRLAAGLFDDLMGLVPGAVDCGAPQAALEMPAENEPP